MASQNVGSIHYELGLDTSKFDKAMAGIGAKTKAVGEKMSSVGKSMTVGLTLPIVAGAALAVKAASDLNENINKVGVAFKKNSKEVINWSKTSIKAMGLAQSSALDAASLFGDMATSMGLNTKEAAKMSMKLTQLGADLASFKNISFAEAQTALAGVFTGETESLKRLGIVMTETNLLEYAKAQGIKKTIQEMTQAEKVQLRYKYVMEKTTNAQGDFIRTGGGTANQIRITQEKFKELSATLGQRLLPFANRVLAALQGFMDKISNLTPKQQDWLLKILATVAAIGPLLIVMGKLVTAVGALIPLFSNPVFLVIAGVLAVIAGAAYLIYRNWDKVKPVIETVSASFKHIYENILKPFVSFIISQYAGAFRDIKSAITTTVQTLKPFKNELALLAKLLGGTLLLAIIAPTVVLTTLSTMIIRLIAWLVKLGAIITKAMIEPFTKVKPLMDGLKSSTNLLNSGMQFLGNTFGVTTSAADKQKDAQNKLKSALDGVKLSTQGLKDAQYDLEGSNLAVERSQKSYTEAVRQYGPKSLEAREALHQLKGAQKAQKDASDTAKSATDKHKKSLDGLRNQQANVAALKAVQSQTARTGGEFDRQRGKPAGFRNSIIGAFRGLGGILYSAGVSIIRGLQSGLEAQFNQVKRFVSGIAKWIADHKGPISYDKKLLIPQGQAILSGFNKGLLDGWKNTEKIISGMTGNISAVARRPEPAVSGRAGLLGGSGTIVNIGTVNDRSDADYILRRVDRDQQLQSMGVSPI